MELSLKRLVLLAALGAAPFGNPAAVVLADDGSSAKELVLENCEEARTAARTLQPEDEKDFYDYLVRVLALRAEPPAAPEAFAIPAVPGGPEPGIGPNAPGVLPANVAAWQSVDPKRERIARHCAVTLFGDAGARAAPWIIPLERLYTEESLTDDVAVRLEGLSARLAEAARFGGWHPSNRDLKALLAHLETHGSLVARNLFIEFPEQSVPFVIRQLEARDTDAARALLSVLGEIDPGFTRSWSVLVAIGPSLSEESRSRLSDVLPPPGREQTATLLPALADGVIDHPQSHTYLRLLGSACERLETLALSEEQREKLASLPQLLTPELLALAQRSCLIQSVPGLAREVWRGLDSPDGGSQHEALLLTEPLLTTLQGAERDSVWKRLRTLAFEGSLDVRKQAIPLLALFPEKRVRVVADYFQILRGISVSKEIPLTEALTMGLLEGLGKLDADQDLSRFGSFVETAFTDPERCRAAAAAAKSLPGFGRTLSKILTSPKPLTEIECALSALPGIVSVSDEAIEAVRALLERPATAGAAEKTLRALGSRAVPVLQKAADRRDPTQIPALTVLLQISAADLSQKDTLAREFSKSDCRNLEGRADAIFTLLHDVALPAEARDGLSSQLRSCIEAVAAVDAERWLARAPTGLLTPETALSLLARQGAGSTLSEQLLSQAAADELAPDARSTVLLFHLQSGSPADQLRALRALDSSLAGHQAILEAVRQISATAANPALLQSARAARVRLLDGDYAPTQFLRNTLEWARESKSSSDTETALAIVDADIAVAEILHALESPSPDNLIGAIRTAGALRPSGVPVLPRLQELRLEHENPAVRFEALAAILSIAPSTEDLQFDVGDLLANRFFPEALRSGVRWANTTGAQFLQQTQLGVLRTARLRQLLDATGRDLAAAPTPATNPAALPTVTPPPATVSASAQPTSVQDTAAHADQLPATAVDPTVTPTSAAPQL